MKIIAIIPARYGSTRLPAKALAVIHGKPMIQHVVERTSRSSLLDDVIVATDDERIETAVKKFGGSVVMTSPDIQSGSDRIAIVSHSTGADIIVNVQGDEPMIRPEMIDQAVGLVKHDDRAAVGTLIRCITNPAEINNPNVVKAVIDNEMFALYFSRAPIPHDRDCRSNLESIKKTVYYKHFGLYVYRFDVLQKFTKLPQSVLEQTEKLEQLRLLENGYKIKTAATEYDTVSVDTAEDLEEVRKRISIF